MEAPLIAFPKEGGGFVLDTDTSEKAIGAVLSQVQDGKGDCIWKFCIEQAQRNYCVTRKYFRHYLWRISLR